MIPVFSKLIERLIFERFVTYINLHKYQCGFQEDKATYAVLVLIEKKVQMC